VTQATTALAAARGLGDAWAKEAEERAVAENQRTEIAGRIVEEVYGCGISLVASLPDGWIADLIERFDGDRRFAHVAVNREESAIGLCSGAFFAGDGALALMGASGLMTCVYAITKINYTYMVPLLLFITMRGRIGDNAKFHVSNGLYLEPVMRALDLPYTVIERRDQLGEIARAYRHSRVISRPVVVGFTREVLRDER
jgi:sulfopyruvate decarboxylase TPP-binding subunit